MRGTHSSSQGLTFILRRKLCFQDERLADDWAPKRKQAAGKSKMLGSDRVDLVSVCLGSKLLSLNTRSTSRDGYDTGRVSPALTVLLFDGGRSNNR